MHIGLVPTAFIDRRKRGDLVVIADLAMGEQDGIRPDGVAISYDDPAQQLASRAKKVEIADDIVMAGIDPTIEDIPVANLHVDRAAERRCKHVPFTKLDRRMDETPPSNKVEQGDIPLLEVDINL